MTRKIFKGFINLNRFVLLSASAIILMLPFAPPAKAISSDTAHEVERALEDFKAGKRHVFRTNDHSKAQGLNLSIAYPLTWKAQESERPHIVQKFMKLPSKSSPDFAMALILVEKVPANQSLSPSELKHHLSPEGLKEAVPDGGTYLGSETVTLENSPAGIVEYMHQEERLGSIIHMRGQTVFIVSGDYIISAQFAVYGKSGQAPDTLVDTYEHYKPIFRLMANSITLPDQHLIDKMPKPTDENTQTILYVLSMIIAASVGLTPPLVTRYLIARQPLGKGAATLLAIAFSVYGASVFVGLAAITNENVPTHHTFFWFIMFFVSRMLLTLADKVEPQNQISGEDVAK